MNMYSYKVSACSEEELLVACKEAEAKGYKIVLIDRHYNDPTDKPPAGEPYGFSDSDYSFTGATIFVKADEKTYYENEHLKENPHS